MKITCPLCQTEDFTCHEFDDDNTAFEVCISKEAVWKEGVLIEEESSEGYDSPVEYYECKNGHGWYM